MCTTKCHHCGSADHHLTGQLVHIGGVGYALVYYCSDQQACWRRWWANSRAEAVPA